MSTKMDARLFIDGRFLGLVEYNLPKTDSGRELQVPRADGAFDSEAGILVRGPDGKVWFGRVKLEQFDEIRFVNLPPSIDVNDDALVYRFFVCRHRARTPKGLCTECGDQS